MFNPLKKLSSEIGKIFKDTNSIKTFNLRQIDNSHVAERENVPFTVMERIYEKMGTPVTQSENEILHINDQIKNLSDYNENFHYKYAKQQKELESSHFLSMDKSFLNEYIDFNYLKNINTIDYNYLDNMAKLKEWEQGKGRFKNTPKSAVYDKVINYDHIKKYSNKHINLNNHQTNALLDKQSNSVDAKPERTVSQLNEKIGEEEYYGQKEQLDNLYGGQKELESKNTIIKESNTESKPSSDVLKEYMEELKAGVQRNEDKSDFWKRAAIRNAEIAVKAYEKNPNSEEALEYLKKIKDNPNSIEPGVMDYVATNPNAVKGVAGGAGLIALTNFLMSDRKGQMTNDELYSQ